MARRTTGLNRAFELIKNIIEVETVSSDRLLIVNEAKLKSILSTIQPETLNKALENEVKGHSPGPELPLNAWVKAARSRAGLSQRKFAELINKKGLKISGSDIGNIEASYRLEHYTQKRLDDIKNAIRLIISEIEEIKNSI